MARKGTTSTQQGLDRALELMEMLSKNGGGMNTSDISKALGITRITAASMVQSLLQRNYIEKDDLTGKYYIGYKFLELAQVYRYRYPFLYAAEEYIRNMAEKLKIRTNVCVLKPPGVAVVLLSKDVSLLPKMIMGYVFPAYASASGKLLLAFAQQEMVDDWLDKIDFVPYTANTICDRGRLMQEFEQIRAQGIAFEYEEMMLQRCCLAAPIRDISGQVIASVSFSASKEYIEQEKNTLIENLQLLAKSISSTQGYNALLTP